MSLFRHTRVAPTVAEEFAMQKIPSLDRRRFCGAAATTVAAGSLSLSGLLFSEGSTAMNAVPQQNASGSAAVRPFHVKFPESDLTELRRRINATMWPERETVSDDSQGVQLATVQELALLGEGLRLAQGRGEA
jgi:epoxide hydrolase-like protein